mgnify:CR=1 FL=1
MVRTVYTTFDASGDSSGLPTPALDVFAPGKPLRIQDIERALLLLNEMPGAAANATMGSPNPVHAATGAKVLGGETELDFVLPGILPIDWQRFYNSRDERRDGLFGAGWSVAYEICVDIGVHPEGGERLIYTDEQARQIDMGMIPPPSVTGLTTRG